MTPERWREIKELLAAAMPMAPEERASWLAIACARDADLRLEVESLLVSHEVAASGFLQIPAAHRLPQPAVDTAPRVGRRIGAYDLVAELGRGGMGEVFAGVRADGEYEQRVAIKLVRAGYATSAVVDRFRAERQILASLDHPNIARLVDGGATEDGAPYLVMELIDGIPIDEFCRLHDLSIAGRLRLFLPVCSAVQYAHQRLVIHRDIKPANILITASGIPKLLDFGIAKMLDPIGNLAETALRPFTPEYASPEQVRGEPVSTASDVYALGVVLYRLLTGRSPYRLESETAGALAVAITSQEPERPSTAASRGEADTGVLTPRLSRHLRGDLDFILLKALRKEPEKRYVSAEQLADDLRRHLEGLPVAARKGTWRYRAGSFTRRHRGAVAAATLLLATLLGGIVVSVREARLAEANRRRAEARFNDVRKLANSLMFEIHDSMQYLPGATPTRRLILQRSLEYLDSLAKESNDEPDLLRELATAYGRIGLVQGNPSFMNLGDVTAARDSAEKSIALRERLVRLYPHNRRDQVDLAAAYIDFAEFQLGAGNVVASYQYAQQARTTLERELAAAPDDSRVLTQAVRALTALGESQVGEGLSGSVGTMTAGVADFDEAKRLADRAVQLLPSDARIFVARANLDILIGDALLKLDDRPNALLHYQRTIDQFAASVQRNDNNTAAFNTAVVYAKMGDAALIDGRPAAAVPYYDAARRLIARLAEAEPGNASIRRQEAITLVSFGHARLEIGHPEEGLRYARQALERLGTDAHSTAVTRATEVLIRGWLGEALEHLDKVRDASQQYAISKQLMAEVRAGGADDRRVRGYFASATDRLAATLVKLNEIEKATQEYEESRALMEPLVRTNPQDQELAYVLAETYAAEGRIAATRAARDPDRATRLVDWRAASGWYRRSLDTWRAVPHPTRISTSGFEVTMPADVSRRLVECDREIASLGGGASDRR